jgi:hypothetical protein
MTLIFGEISEISLSLSLPPPPSSLSSSYKQSSPSENMRHASALAICLLVWAMCTWDPCLHYTVMGRVCYSIVILLTFQITIRTIPCVFITICEKRTAFACSHYSGSCLYGSVLQKVVYLPPPTTSIQYSRPKTLRLGSERHITDMCLPGWNAMSLAFLITIL